MTRGEFLERVDGWLAAGRRVAGPVRVRAKLLYAWVESASELELDAEERPSNSIKQFFFPMHERLFGYRFEGKSVELVPAEADSRERVVISARPCDSAAIARLDALFNWDAADEFYNRRRRATTIVTLACTHHDAACFCTSVGSGPSDTAGSDAMLFGGTLALLSEKGAALFGGAVSAAPSGGAAGPHVKIDAAAIGRFLAGGFESPVWKEQSLACLGCGVCAYTCPTCHCFDIVDEGAGRGGWRVKNWDSCQFPTFTAHASGHNPRPEQGSRQRQRIYHKFDLYPKRFGSILCTGCGACQRNCPAGLGVLPVLEAIANA
jgi:ferredoxin